MADVKSPWLRQSTLVAEPYRPLSLALTAAVCTSPTPPRERLPPPQASTWDEYTAISWDSDPAMAEIVESRFKGLVKHWPVPRNVYSQYDPLSRAICTSGFFVEGDLVAYAPKKGEVKAYRVIKVCISNLVLSSTTNIQQKDFRIPASKVKKLIKKS